MLVELDAILGHLNVLGSSYAINPNEFFVSKANGPDPVEEITSLVRFTARVYDQGRRARSRSWRPPSPAQAGRPMVLLSLLVVLLATAFSYASYLLLFSRSSRGEVGFLESLGLSRTQLHTMLAFEHLAVVGIGIGLGTWAGFLMSRIMVGYLAVTEGRRSRHAAFPTRNRLVAYGPRIWNHGRHILGTAIRPLQVGRQPRSPRPSQDWANRDRHRHTWPITSTCYENRQRHLPRRKP